ncbi:MAG: formylglycine-generating enzyme family protein [Lentisphaeria bacterium]|nr:formylglycine-generating enzyme family protein [Lentisphaeria bacterium]
MPTAPQTAVPPPPAQFNPNFQNQFGGGGPKPFPKGLLKIIGIFAVALVLITVIIIAIDSVRFRPEELTLPQGVKLEMVKITAGSFTMGSPAGELGRENDEAQHQVTLTKDYWLGKYEVTQAQWKAVMGSNPSTFIGDNLPVECVIWHDAKEFCKKLNEIYADKLPAGYQFDLPTEAQWEYACRAGTTTDLNNGKNLTSVRGECYNLNEVAWYTKNSGDATHEVGQKRANAWGLYDMHGNVLEWCRDWYGAYPGRSVTDPVGPSSGSERVLRGGGRDFYAFCCRSADRHGVDPAFRFGSDGLGFRLALVPIQ